MKQSHLLKRFFEVHLSLVFTKQNLQNISGPLLARLYSNKRGVFRTLSNMHKKSF